MDPVRANPPGAGYTKTGECFWIDDNGDLWLAESWQDAAGEVVTTQTKQPTQ